MKGIKLGLVKATCIFAGLCFSVVGVNTPVIIEEEYRIQKIYEQNKSKNNKQGWKR